MTIYTILSIASVLTGVAAACGFVLLGVSRPGWVICCAPLLVPLSHSSVPMATLLPAAAAAAALLGAATHGNRERMTWAAIPVVIIGMLVVREWADPLGSPSALLYTVAGLGLGAAATLKPPNIPGFLLSCVLAGTIYGIVSRGGTFIELGRAGGILGENANGVGMLGGTGVVAAATLLAGSFALWMKVAAAVLGIGCVYALGASDSQGAWLGVAVGLVVILWYSRRWLTLPAIAVLCAFAVTVRLPSVATAFGGQARDLIDLEASSDVRSELLRASIDAFLARPVSGWGRNPDALDPFMGVAMASHDVYLEVLLLGGVLLGLALACWVSFVLLRRGSQSARRMVMPLLAATAAFGLTTHWFAVTYSVIPFIGIGLIASDARSTSANRSATSLRRTPRESG